MKLDIVTKGIPFLHMAVIVVMVLVGVPRIFTYTSLFWVYCTIMSIPITEEELYLEFPTLMAVQTSVRFGSLLHDFTEYIT